MVDIIFGGQFGSEGKGLAASYLVKGSNGYDFCTTDAGPNSGHTAVWNGKEIITYHLPMMGVLSPNAIIYLNGGAIIDPKTLYMEIETLEEQGFNIRERLIIHPKAAVILPQHKEAEKDPNGAMHRISSTQKGVGEAIASKVLRNGVVAVADPFLSQWVRGINVYEFISKKFSIEVSQGYSLGCNTRFYPYTTARVCTPAQGLMNAGVPTTIPHSIMAVIRINPIRVGNLEGASSGDKYYDQDETTWKELGLEPQLTTVTKRVRRVFTPSRAQIEEMIEATMPQHILINFCNQAKTGQVPMIKDWILNKYHSMGRMHPSLYFGYGPAPEDVREQI